MLQSTEQADLQGFTLSSEGSIPVLSAEPQVVNAAKKQLARATGTAAKSDRRRPRAIPKAEPAPSPRLANWEAEPKPQRYLHTAFEGVVRFTIPADFNRVSDAGCTTVTVLLSPQLAMRIIDYSGALDAIEKGREHVITGMLTIRRNPKNPLEFLSAILDVNNLAPEHDVARTTLKPKSGKSRLPVGAISQFRFCDTRALEVRRIASAAEARLAA
jgi:hypothetical protein